MTRLSDHSVNNSWCDFFPVDSCWCDFFSFFCCMCRDWLSSLHVQVRKTVHPLVFAPVCCSTVWLASLSDDLVGWSVLVFIVGCLVGCCFYGWSGWLAGKRLAVALDDEVVDWWIGCQLVDQPETGWHDCLECCCLLQIMINPNSERKTVTKCYRLLTS